MSIPANFTVDDTATITVAETDDHGDPTSDQLSFVSDDGGAVLTLTPGTDGKSCLLTPVAEGLANVTISDPAAPSVAPQVVAVQVAAGATSTLAVSVTVNPGANPAPVPPAAP